MKKILLILVAVATICATSCKKDVESVPAKTLKVNDGPAQVAKSDVRTWE